MAVWRFSVRHERQRDGPLVERKIKIDHVHRLVFVKSNQPLPGEVAHERPLVALGVVQVAAVHVEHRVLAIASAVGHDLLDDLDLDRRHRLLRDVEGDVDGILPLAAEERGGGVEEDPVKRRAVWVGRCERLDRPGVILPGRLVEEVPLSVLTRPELGAVGALVARRVRVNLARRVEKQKVAVGLAVGEDRPLGGEKGLGVDDGKVNEYGFVRVPVWRGRSGQLTVMAMLGGSGSSACSDSGTGQK